jgi:hypothetical protein
MDCKGLDCFPSTEEDAIKFMEVHNMFNPEMCPTHNTAGTPIAGRPGYRMCSGRTAPAQVGGKQGRCQTILCDTAPHKHGRSNVSFLKLLRVWIKMGLLAKHSTACFEVGLGKEAVTRIQRAVCQCCLHQQETPLQANKVQVDETYFGKRKYNRGANARKRCWWFITICEVDNDGKTCGVRWMLCKARTMDVIKPFILRHINGERTLVVTDFFRAYQTILREVLMDGKHQRVNHSVEWKNDRGFTTNNAEGSHSVVKGFVKDVWHKFGSSSATLRERVAFGCVMMGRNCDSKRMQGRLQRLFIAIRDHAGKEPLEEWNDSVHSESDNDEADPERAAAEIDSEDEDEQPAQGHRRRRVPAVIDGAAQTAKDALKLAALKVKKQLCAQARLDRARLAAEAATAAAERALAVVRGQPQRR